MLRESPLDVVLLATDLDVARDFYSNKLGLPLINGSEQSLTFSCGDGSRVIISKSESGTADSQTQAQWRVEDLAAELSDLRSRSVKIEEYDGPGFKTEDGIYDAGFAPFRLDHRSSQECAGTTAVQVTPTGRVRGRTLPLR